MRRMRLAVRPTRDSLYFWNSGRVRMKFPLSGHRPLKRKMPWMRLTRRASTKFSTTGMVVVLSHIIFMEANSRFHTGCRTRLSHYPQSSSSILDAPQVSSLPKPPRMG